MERIKSKYSDALKAVEILEALWKFLKEYLKEKVAEVIYGKCKVYGLLIRNLLEKVKA